MSQATSTAGTPSVIMQPIALQRSMCPNIYGWLANSTGGIRSIVRWLRFLGALKAGASSESTGGRRVRRDAWQVLSRHLPIWYTSGCFVSSTSARSFQPRERSGNKGDDALARSRSRQRENASAVSPRSSIRTPQPAFVFSWILTNRCSSNSAKPQRRLRSVQDLYEGLSPFMANERFNSNIL